MKKASWLIIVGLWVSPLWPGPAAPCADGSLHSYVVLGGTGCDIGALTVKDFQFLVQDSSVGYAALTDTLVNVSVYASGSPVGMRFTADPASSGFHVAGNEFVHYVLTYAIDPPPIIIRGDEPPEVGGPPPGGGPPPSVPPPPPKIIAGFEVQLVAQSPVPPGLARIITDLCVGHALNPSSSFCIGPSGQLIVFDDGTAASELVGSALIVPPIHLLGVRHQIELTAGGASADFNALVTETQTIPEPASWLLLGCGLLPLLTRTAAPRWGPLS